MLKMSKYVSRLFWENEDFGGDACIQYVTSRVMEMGDDRQVNWMLRHFDNSQISEVLKDKNNFEEGC